MFPPAKAFDGDKIDAIKNRHIPSVTFQGIPLIAELVKCFEDKYAHLKVRSVWIIEKSRENNSFQGWHRDFYLGAEVTTTIVVNVGTVTKNLSLLYDLPLSSPPAYMQPGFHQLTGELKR